MKPMASEIARDVNPPSCAKPGDRISGAAAQPAQCARQRIRAPSIARILLALAVPIVMTACSGETHHGPPSPPEDFGPQDTDFFGCPSMAGMYAWPPEAGEYSNGINSNEQPWPGMLPVPIGRGRMQVWALEEGRRLTLLSRDTPADGNTDPGLRRAWGYSEHEGLKCRSDMLDADDEELDPDAHDYGCAGLRRGFRLARMADGALAVGIRTVAYDCRESITVWGDASVGDVKIPDQVYWKWSKLRRIGEATPAPAATGS